VERRVTESVQQESTDGGRQLLLGKRLLERGVITPDQLREALAERARGMTEGLARPLGTILVSRGFLTDAQLMQLLEEPGRPPSSSGSDGIPGFGPAAGPGGALNRLGKYALLKELGRGGMGVVYESMDTQLNRKVALKLMLTNPNADPKEASIEEERFIQESQLAAKLKHPNIVTVYEAGVLEGRRFLAMELIEGQPLSDWRRDSGLGTKDIVALLRDVAQAVHHAHEQGVLHRDLKPRNVLVGIGNHPYVTDFGLAKSLGAAKSAHSLTGSGTVVGTPAYMSPEQAQGNERVDWRADIWSLGVMLYEILTGRTPFTGESPIEILMKVVKDPVQAPSTVVEGAAALAVDRGIENICLKALAKKQTDRYATARAFAEDLTKWLSGERVTTAPPRPRRSFRRAYVAGGALGLLALVGLTLLFRPTVSVTTELGQAARFMELGNFTEAMVAYRLVLEKDASNAEALAGLERARVAAEKKSREGEEKLRRELEEARRKEKEAEEKLRVKAREIEEAPTETERQRLEEEARKAEAEAVAARLKLEELERVKQAAAKTPPVSVPLEEAWKQAVRLLPSIDPARHSVWGTWVVQDGRLVSDREKFARIEIPYVPPEEYDLRTVFRRRGGSDAVAMILSTRAGRAFSWEMGGMGNKVLSFESVKDSRAYENPTTVRSARALENDRLYTSIVQVRRDGVKAYLDGELVAEMKTDASNLSLDTCWGLRSPVQMGLGTNESPAEFHSVDLLEVSGKGRRPLPIAARALKPAAVDIPALRPGLVAEYFYGTRFDVPAVQKIEAIPVLQLGEGPAWAGGPPDSFSVRWTGFLLVPRAGRYTFTAACDDGMRLVIGESQVLASGISASDSQRPAVCVLEEGFHRILIEYFERAHVASLAVSWSEVAGSSATAQIPAKSLFHLPAEFKPMAPARPPELLKLVRAHSREVTSAVFSPNGQTLATAGQDRRVKVWNPGSGRDTSFLPGHPAAIMSAAFNPAGAILATGAWDHKVRIWEVAAGADLRTLEGHGDSVDALAFSPDGKWLASGSFDRTIRIWDAAAWTHVRTLAGHGGGVHGLAWGPDSKVLVSCGADRTIRFWDAGEGKEIRVLAGHADEVRAVAWSPDGTQLASASADGTVRIWSAEGKELRSMPGHSAEALSVAWSPDGKILASGGADAMVRIWDGFSGRWLRTLPGHMESVLRVTFAPEGRLLVSAGFDGTVRLWDLKSW
jgi:WD40 repeat protein/serine/threonine protein kinase